MSFDKNANSDMHEKPYGKPQAPSQISVDTADKASKDYSVPLPFNDGSTPNGPVSGRHWPLR